MKFKPSSKSCGQWHVLTVCKADNCLLKLTLANELMLGDVIIFYIQFGLELIFWVFKLSVTWKLVETNGSLKYNLPNY
jgi:hypothetical protein